MFTDINTLKIMSFDLGNFLGIAISEFNINTKILKVIKTSIINLEKYIKTNNLSIDEIQRRKAIKLYSFETAIEKYLYDNRINGIDLFITEDIFIYTKRITAFISLINYISKLDEIINIQYNKDLIKIPPRMVKRNFNQIQKGKATKEDMLNALLDKKDISFFNNKKLIVELTEHEIDAIAVAYTGAKQLIKECNF